MKILVDMTVYQIGSDFHGGGEYSYTILYALLERIGADEQVHIFIGEMGRRDDAFLSDMEKRGVTVHLCRNPSELSQLLIKEDIDVLYSSLPTIQYFGGLKVPDRTRLILTIHGLRKTELKEEGLYPRFKRLGMLKNDLSETLLQIFDKKAYKRQLLKEYGYLLRIRDDYTLITGSWHSYYNILRHFPQVAGRIKMCECPPKTEHRIDDADLEARILKDFGVESGQYGLMLSMDRPEKNPHRNMAAFDLVFDEASGIIPQRFKCVGLGAKDPSVYLGRVKHKDRFILKGYVEDAELETLYKHAHVVVFTSLNEGFGYPPMEAMKYGTMVIASVNTSIPESCGDAAFMCNPLMPTEIANRILQSFEPALVREKRALIPRQYERITALQEEGLGLIVDEILHCHQ